MSFDSLGLSAPILQAVAEQGYNTPSPIQAQAIPAVLNGKDVMAAAQTGTGKTAGFTLPVLELLSRGTKAAPNHIRALVLTPTRELAAQVGENVAKYGKHLPLRSQIVFGGVGINPQMMQLRKGCDILIATPGRLIDLYNQKAVKFNQLEILVLDEADRMLDMGFIHDIRRIMTLLPKQRQNLLFSATFSEDIRALAKGIINDPIEISVTPRNATAASVEQCIHPVDKPDKSQLLAHLIKQNQWSQVLVFSRTKHGADRLARFLIKKSIPSAAIHGNKSQGARTRALSDFKDGRVQVLVATDIAARGIDIDQLPQVVNFDLPNVSEDYVHRIGRTGRAGAVGKAVSLVSAEEFKLLSDIERLTQKIIPREIIKGFEPDERLPESRLRPPAGAKKPKKPKDPSKNTSSPNQGNRAQAQNGNSNKPAQGDRKRRFRKPRTSTTAAKS
ncbi:DEAD/DEAH box helicase [Neptunomonas phycophila]|uniref:DEAD/DEAH box helicase n=1 Tax=Neptunomonas phycophila TaxID=1572645 RepID=UPI000948FA67|nr:DEAD/DEAH box helicase [Neptunomonas phycophila]QLE98610.1 DEAD/DEAH box helicase [Neptunomonas phycophila]